MGRLIKFSAKGCKGVLIIALLLDDKIDLAVETPEKSD